MHPFAHHDRSEPSAASAKATNGLILKGGWRYDLHGWFLDTCLFRGKGRELRYRAVSLAGLHPGEAVLDVGFAWASTFMLERTIQAQTSSRPTRTVMPIAM